MADAVVVIGNEFIRSTYLPYNPRVFTIDNSTIPTMAPDLEHKDFASARRNFLAFPSAGLLHKGLDLILEVFAELNDLDLWVCGPLRSEAEHAFIRAYRRELFYIPNIHSIGWVNIHSEQFIQLTDMCAALIFPSCSEAMASGVLTCMGRGIIPLVSKETGIDTNGLGVIFEECNKNMVRQVIADMATRPLSICQKMAYEAYKQADARYSLDSFSRNIEHILRKILNQN